jgi:hypothetical protein
MKYSGPANTLTIDLDEAKYLAKQSVSWNGNTVQDKKIIAAKAVLELLSIARKESRALAYGESAEI